jgi:hypothetical protein
MVGPYEGLSLVARNRFGSGCTYFSGRLRRRFWLEYWIHGLTDEFTSHAKRYLSLMAGRDQLRSSETTTFGRDELLLVRSIVEDTESEVEPHQKHKHG